MSARSGPRAQVGRAPDPPSLMSLFKKLDPKADLGTPSSLKSSVQRGIRAKLLEQYASTLGADEGALLEKIWPKKEPITSAKFKCV